MRNVSQVLIPCSIALTLVALVPCLGWLNWFAIPVSLGCAITGGIGLATDREPDGTAPASGLHAAALVVGLAMVLIGGVRCLLGGGVV